MVNVLAPLTALNMSRAVRRAALVLLAALMPSEIFAQTAASRVLFRVFLSDGRVLSSYGEWARLDDRVIFSMPTQLSREPIELHLVTIPAQRVDWPRTEQYAESVRAAAYAASSGEADFAVFSSEVAKALNEVAQTKDPEARLATAERARQRLLEWPAAHYGYRVNEVRDALDVLDEIIAQLRVAAGITRFDLSLTASAPLTEPPPPPLPPPTDAELVEQFVAAASISEAPAERVSMLQTVLRLLDRVVGLMPAEWAARMRKTAGGELDRERRIEDEYQRLWTRTLAEASKLAAKGRASDLEKLRDKVRAEDRRLGGQRSGEVSATLATIDSLASAAIRLRAAREQFERSAPAFRRYRRSTNGIFAQFKDASRALEEIRSMQGPDRQVLGQLADRLLKANQKFLKVTTPADLADSHAVIANAWELADNAFRFRLQAVQENNMDLALRASSAAAGALLLYQRGRADLLTAMTEPPAAK